MKCKNYNISMKLCFNLMNSPFDPPVYYNIHKQNSFTDDKISREFFLYLCQGSMITNSEQSDFFQTTNLTSSVTMVCINCSW
jgi:hypothetical protein